MPNRILKTIFKDFFKLRYVIIWLALIIFIGAGVVWAFTLTFPNGIFISSGHTRTIDNPFGNNTCVTVSNTGSSAYFIPTRTRNELTQFNVHAPLNFPNITVANCSSSCVPTTPCQVGQCGVDSCGTACGTVCSTSDFCNEARLCQPIILACGNPKQICPAGYYCSTATTPKGVCLPVGIY